MNPGETIIISVPHLCHRVQPHQWIQKCGYFRSWALFTSVNEAFIRLSFFMPETFPRLSVELRSAPLRDGLERSSGRHIFIEVSGRICRLHIHLEIMDRHVFTSMYFKQHLQLIRVKLGSFCAIVINVYFFNLNIFILSCGNVGLRHAWKYFRLVVNLFHPFFELCEITRWG